MKNSTRRTSDVEGSVPWCELVQYKRPTLDEGRISFTLVELKKISSKVAEIN